MAIPLPSGVADVGPGGRLVTSLRGQNALAGDILGNMIKGTQAQYAPATTLANTMSKMAYANLLGPQFVAKLFGNPNVLANIKEPQKNPLLQGLISAGMNQPGGGNMLSLIANAMNSGNNSQGFSLSRYLGNMLAGRLSQAPEMQQQIPEEAPVQEPNAINPMPAPQGAPQNALSQTPAQVPYQPVQQQAGFPAAHSPSKTFSENVGGYEGTVSEGKELGTLRAKAIDEVDKDYESSLNQDITARHLIKAINSPGFQQMREEIPLFQGTQLAALSKLGTPEQQKQIGDFISSVYRMQADMVNSFSGRVLAKEFGITDRIKVSPNDTWNTMIGKLNAIMTLNETRMQLDRQVSRLMESEHLNRGNALESAMKGMDMNKIDDRIQSEINTLPDGNIALKKGDRLYHVPPDRVPALLKQKGVSYAN